MTFSQEDKKIMELALNEAKVALKNKDYPVGAVLVIDGKVIATKRNSLYSEENWASHAELSILKETSAEIKKAVKQNNSCVELFTTLEPCLMCLGSCVLHRVSRIVFACPDPHGGATHLNPKNLTDWYIRKWPKIEGGLFKEKVYKIMVEFMKNKDTDTWREILKMYEKMHESW